MKIGYSTSGKNYAVQLSSEKMYVNVPWTDTTYSAGTGLSLSGTTFSNSGVTGVKGNNEGSYRTGQVNLTSYNIGAVAKNDELQTTNPFAPPSLKGPYISKIDNAYYAANKRWNITGITDNEASMLFDGSYEGQMVIAKGTSKTFTIDFENSTNEIELYNGVKCFPGYPYGYILVSFYFSSIPESVTGRAYCNYAQHTIGWHDITFTKMSDSTNNNYVYRGRQNWYAISKLEITITAKSDINAGVTEVEMHLDRPYSGRTPFLSKYAAETLYYDLTAPKFIGSLQGNASTATNVAWSGVTSKPTTLSGYGITDSVLKWQTSTTAATNVYDFGVYVAQGTGGATGPANGNYYAMLNIPYRKAFGNTKADYSWSIAGSTNDDKRLFYRTSGADTWGDWAEVAHINVGTAVGNATQPVYITNTGVVTACTSYANASVNHATSADSATSATKVGNSGIWLYANNNNEINFGGTNTSTTIFMGYRVTDSRSIPTKFIFGSSTGTADLQAKTVYLGSGTTSYISSTQYTGNAATATKATQDKNGNDITTKYVTIDTTQTITGRKTFNDLAAVTFKPSSGTDNCSINYDAALGALVFSF